MSITFKNKVNLGPRDDLPEILAWCEANIGNRYTTWHRVGKYFGADNGKFRFRYKKDATLFALKWA